MDHSADTQKARAFGAHFCVVKPNTFQESLVIARRLTEECVAAHRSHCVSQPGDPRDDISLSKSGIPRQTALNHKTAGPARDPVHPLAAKVVWRSYFQNTTTGGHQAAMR